MLRPLLVFWFILLLPTLAAASDNRGIALRPVAPGGATVAGDQWLLVIGIDNYLSWPPLRTAVNDARSLRDLLLERYHFDREHLIELYDADATRKNILSSFVRLAKTLKPEDSLLIYYAGHGHLDPITRAGSWVPVESGTDEPSAWVSNSDIKNYLSANAIKARHILLISDSCFAGDFFRGQRGALPEVTDAVIAKAWQLDSRQAMTSGGVEPVSDAGFGNHSVFAHFLLESLKGNDKPFLIPSELFPRVKSGVAQNAEQFPQFGALFGVGGQEGGEYVFFLRQQDRLANLSREESSRQHELDRLKGLEAAAAVAKDKEQAEIRRREAELAALDAQIAEMRRRLGTASGGSDDTLQAMLTMVRQKEEQAQRLEQLRREREEEERRRRGDIERLKGEQESARRVAIEADLKTYEEIANSPYGKEMAPAAWQSLVARYPAAAQLDRGDVAGFRATVLGIRSWREQTTGTELVFVKGGCFSMGDASGAGATDERPTHEVCVDDLYVGKYEVTQGEWQQVMGNNPSNFRRGANYPVEQVSWNDVQNFLARLQRLSGKAYRLPSEAEWEFAARSGGRNETFAGTSDQRRLATFANVCDFSCAYEWKAGDLQDRAVETAPVGTYQPNGVGLYDMTGNVWEWCSDWYAADYYQRSERTNPPGAERGQGRVFRGGSWANEPAGCRAANRASYTPGKSGFDLGFRIVIPAAQID